MHTWSDPFALAGAYKGDVELLVAKHTETLEDKIYTMGTVFLWSSVPGWVHSSCDLQEKFDYCLLSLGFTMEYAQNLQKKKYI